MRIRFVGDAGVHMVLCLHPLIFCPKSDNFADQRPLNKSPIQFPRFGVSPSDRLAYRDDLGLNQGLDSDLGASRLATLTVSAVGCSWSRNTQACPYDTHPNVMCELIVSSDHPAFPLSQFCLPLLIQSPLSPPLRP
jgi:hypothetical protein